MNPKKLLNVTIRCYLLATLNKKLGQKLVDLEKRTQRLAWIELLLKKIVMRAIANAKIFIQNIIQQVEKLLLGERFDNRLSANNKLSSL